MKERLTVSLLFALLALSGCAAAGGRLQNATVPATVISTVPAGSETAETETTRNDSCVDVPFTAQYIYTGSSAVATFPDVQRVDSREVLEEYYRQHRDIFVLDRNHDDSIGFWEICQRYDHTFFENRCLVMVLLEEGSGSNRHEVRQVRREADGSLSISIDTLEPECGTCDMAQWHILLELPREYVPENPDKILLFWNERLAWHGTPIHPGPLLDASRLSSPPEGTLYHPNGSTPLVKGGFSWCTTAEDGTVSALMADALHPLQFGDQLTPVALRGDYVKLDFDILPDKITVRCWSDTDIDADSIPEGVTVATEGLTFEPLSGGYVYEINATWSEEGRMDYGTATYAVHLIRS